MERPQRELFNACSPLIEILFAIIHCAESWTYSKLSPFARRSLLLGDS